MTDTFFVADVGNTRIKAGRCRPDRVTDAIAIAPDDPEQWDKVLSGWRDGPGQWALAGVHPGRRDRFAAWLRDRGNRVRLLTDYRAVPIRVDVEVPEMVGIDRLLDAIAVVPHIPPGHRGVVIDAGSAVTVDLVEREGVFRGGAILPGLRLMGRALRDHTAQLPLVESFADDHPPLPARNTTAAIAAGIFYAVSGGIERLVEEYERAVGPVFIAVAGGDAEQLRLLRHPPDLVNPWLTLDGLRRAVLHQS
jgi:type III pantothenate kinase